MDFDTLMTQLETNRPDLSDSLRMIREIQKNKSSAPSEETIETNRQLEELLSLLAKQKKVNQELLDNYEKLQDSYKGMMNQLDEFAAATGACHLCWGEIPECDHCHGNGKPGYFKPVDRYFRIYIDPLISKLKQNKPQSFNN